VCAAFKNVQKSVPSGMSKSTAMQQLPYAELACRKW